jgi:two-component system CheB/CheR fusion protein
MGGLARAWSESARVRSAATALLVCVACAAGAVGADALRFPHIGTALLYPPYAVITVALLLSPPRQWWIYLLAGSIGSYVPNRLGGAPVSFVLMAEIANGARALLAAWGVRRFGDPRRLDTLKGMTVFLLFAVVLAPLASAFVGAGVVALHFGAGGYWLAWRAWLLSNVLTGLTLLPIIFLARVHLVGRPLRALLRRWREVVGLALGLAVLGAAMLLAPNSIGVTLYAPLPLLLWAAVRFGPGGTSTVMLVVTLVAIVDILGERGPFVAQSVADGLLELQLFLFVIAVPLLLLSALLQEQRRTAEELRASKDQYRTVGEDQTELICRFRPDGALTFVNGAFCRAMGRTAPELLGNFFWTFVPSEPRDAQTGLLAGLTPEQPLLTWEHRLGAGGDSRWEQWRIRSTFDGAGRVLDYQAVGRDISERKRAEEEHAMLESQRAHADALREADRRKDEFLAMLAHELRNPLAPIAMAVEILRQVPSTDEHLGSARDIIGRQTAQLARLVDDLLDVARITSGSIQLRRETVDLAQIVGSTLEISRPLIVARRLQLDVDLPPGPLTVTGDSVRLAQLFSNLLNNAAKYSQPLGRIGIAVRRDGGDIVLRFEDAGVGIPRDMLERIFEPFTQVQMPRDAALGGLGLGLALVKKLVELHGGTVRASSDGADRGSEFVVRLPAAAASERARPVANPVVPDPAAGGAEPAGAAALRILVVDDVADAADTLAQVLRFQGDTVQVAHDGRTALDLAQLQAPDIVFVDLQMPGMDGLEVARRLRAAPDAARMMLVAMTGFGQLDDHRQTAAAGFDHHLTKPVAPSVVLNLIASRRRSYLLASAAE